MDLSLSDLDKMIENKIVLMNGNGHSHDKKLTHGELADIIPTNFSECPGGDCGHQTLRSTKFTKSFWECPECESNANPDHSHTCLTCGRNVDVDDRNDSSIELKDGEN